MVTIPIMIDDIKIYDDFKMTRCSYFSIEASEPQPGWNLEFNSIRFPFLLVGLQGIITQPATGEEFSSDTVIDELFETVERGEKLFVDINDIWLPNVFFDERYHKIGNVFRISEQLFSVSYNYRHGTINKSEFFQSFSDDLGQITFSEIETWAFKAWEEKQIDNAKSNYYEKQDLALKWRDSGQSTKPDTNEPLIR